MKSLAFPKQYLEVVYVSLLDLMESLDFGGLWIWVSGFVVLRYKISRLAPCSHVVFVGRKIMWRDTDSVIGFLMYWIV